MYGVTLTTDKLAPAILIPDAILLLKYQRGALHLGNHRGQTFECGPQIPLRTGLLSFAASEIAADEFAAKNRPPCNGPPI